MKEYEQMVKEWYGKLCAALRQTELKRQETFCLACGRPRKDHHYEDLRCTLYVCTTNYRPVNGDEVDRMVGTLGALERLAGACGWNL